MTESARNGAAWRSRSRWVAVLGVSLGLHGAILGGLALQGAPSLTLPAMDPAFDERVIDIQIVDRPRAPRAAERIAVVQRDPTDPRAMARLNAPPSRRLYPLADPAPLGPAAAPAATPTRSGQRPSFRAGACAYPSLLSPADRAACDQRFGARAGGAVVIAGSGDALRDGRFQAEGDQALAAYEERRAVRAAQRPQCDKRGPIADCEVEVSVTLFSSRRGLLPRLLGDD